MGRLNNSITVLHGSLAHAVYEGFPEHEYEDRDWEHYRKTREDRTVKKRRKHTEYDVEVYAMFSQVWASTALGFGGIGGAAMTDAYTVVLESYLGAGYCVYFGGQFAYRIERPTDEFFQDMRDRRMVAVSGARKRYEREN